MSEIVKCETTGLFYEKNGEILFLLPGQNEKMYCHRCQMIFGSGEKREYSEDMPDLPYHPVCLENLRHARLFPNRFWGGE